MNNNITIPCDSISNLAFNIGCTHGVVLELNKLVNNGKIADKEVVRHINSLSDETRNMTISLAALLLQAKGVKNEK